MRFLFEPEGERREVIIKAQRVGNDWIASAILLPTAPGEPEELLRTGAGRVAVQVRSAKEQQAVDRMAFILEGVYGCSRIS